MPPEVLHVMAINAVAVTLCAAVWPAFGAAASVRTGTFFALVLGLFAFPLVLSNDPPFARALAAVVCGTYAVKLIDLEIGARRGESPVFWQHVCFILNPTSLCFRKLKDEPRATTRECLLCLMRAAICGGACAAAAFSLPWEAMGRTSFWLEHTAKTFNMMLGVYGATEGLSGTWRLLGLPGRKINHNFFVARTPAEFWRLYNRPVTQFFHENVFKQVGGIRRPALAAMLAFVLSGLMHEELATMGTGRVNGGQTAFFVLQGLGVVATSRWRPHGSMALVARILTTVFMVTTGVFFYAGVAGVAEWYSQAAPGWVVGR